MEIKMDTSVLIAKLEQLAAQVTKEGKRRALRAGGNVIKHAMQDRAPILKVKQPGSNSLEPGALRNGMRVLLDSQGADEYAMIGPRANVEHVARWQEFGHRVVTGGYSALLKNGKTRGPGRKIKNVPPRPFLRPAYEESVGAAMEAVRESLGQTIRDEVR